MNLNSNQQAAVAAREGAYLIVAGPGAGKTFCLTERFKALRFEGVPEDQILSLTFTRQAALEMAKRAGLPAGQRVFRTFHSFCLDLITREAVHLPFHLAANPIPTAGQARKLVVTLVRKYSLCNYKNMVAHISSWKRNGTDPQTALAESETIYEIQYAQAYFDYEDRCRKEGWLDFDSMLVEANRLLESNSEIRDRWQVPWVQVDEAQDTDEIQFQLLKLITEKHGNLWVVGDFNQCIYMWCGAAPAHLTNFSEHFPGAKTLYLGLNYRSTQNIVIFLKEILPVDNGLANHMRTENEQGEPPSFICYDSDTSEATDVLASVADPDQTAILARTNRQLARFEHICINRGIKYKLLGRSGFWHQNEVKNLVAFLQVCHFPTPAAMKRVIMSPYAPTRFLKKKDLIKTLTEECLLDGGYRFKITDLIHPRILSPLENHQQENVRRLGSFLTGLQQEIRNMRAGDAVREIIERTGILDYYETEEENPEDNDAEENINEVYRIARDIGDIPQFLKYVQKALSASRSRKGLTLSTVHQAKGKEWLVVNVVGVSEGILPHKLGDLEEEKRIFFVACSRASKRLNVSFFGTPSRFIPREKVAQAPILNVADPTAYLHNYMLDFKET